MENSIVEKYLNGLQEHLSEKDKEQLSFAYGATNEEIAKLKAEYPQCPESLIALLSKINGTYWQKYNEHEIEVLILGSDVEEYPYYLKSVDQMLDVKYQQESISERYEGFSEEASDLVGEGIDPDVKMSSWLCFSDCMNNGGTSRLYIDFNPGPNGTHGQVIRFLHDPDNFKVIASSFDEYLQQLMDVEYNFIVEEW